MLILQASLPSLLLPWLFTAAQYRTPSWCFRRVAVVRDKFSMLSPAGFALLLLLIPMRDLAFPSVWEFLLYHGYESFRRVIASNEFAAHYCRMQTIVFVIWAPA